MTRRRWAPIVWSASSILLVIAVAATGATVLMVGDLGVRDSWTLRGFEARQSFSAEAWKRASPEQRGMMLLDLLHTHRFVGLHRDSVVALLGPPDCYVVQDGWPCYTIALDGRSSAIEFLLSHEQRNTVRRVALARDYGTY